MLHPNSTLYSYYKTKEILLSINNFIDFDICTYGTKRNYPSPAATTIHVECTHRSLRGNLPYKARQEYKYHAKI